MPLGVDLMVYDIGAIDKGDFYIKFTVRNKNDGFNARFLHKEILPYLNGGEFNIMHSPEDKNKDNFDKKWPDLLNKVIQSLDLREINMSSLHYTWASNGITQLLRS
ncbi:hypothetical protein U9M48_014390 [Paspalum notatum var. saurae]|uniref:Uncharacterized protein n=1 Tax=Paspalum notatum var. saurae TaxID=547442 RepID=A0AAQ3WKG5_PASNO